MVEETPAGKEPFWRGSARTGWNEFIKWSVVGVLGLVASAAVLVGGWFATGGPARALGALPSGAVVAFTKPCDKDNGWQNYLHGTGRTIVGASPADMSQVNLDEKGQPLTRRELNKSGGAEGFTLTKDDVPPQDVVVVFNQGANVFLLENFAGRNADNSQPLIGYSNTQTPPTNSITLRTNGKGQKHEYMPPYIVLYYCEKT